MKMSLDTNGLLLSGTLGADVEVETFGESAYARFSVTTTYRFPGDGGQQQVATTRTRILAFGELALKLRRLGMGSRVLLRGRLRQASFTSGPASFQFPEVVAISVKFLQVVPPALAPTPAVEEGAPI
jgi:single-stranded DNA-binding protein